MIVIFHSCLIMFYDTKMRRKHLSVFSIGIVQTIFEHNCFQRWLLNFRKFGCLKASNIKEIHFLCIYISSTTSNPYKQSLLAVVTKEHYLEINTETTVHILQRSIDNCCIMRFFYINLKEQFKVISRLSLLFTFENCVMALFAPPCWT